MKKSWILFLLFYSVTYGQSHKELIETPFARPQDVTNACLQCHETSAIEVMATTHWTWAGHDAIQADGQTPAQGKRNFINNFCIAVPSNYPRCTSCHVGYGWAKADFDFTSQENVDCLVCHDQSGTYVKLPTAAGMPAREVDLLLCAQSVGKPNRKNCGKCHFDGGGGTGVKHGDLDDSLYDPTPDLDVHMGKLGFTCVSCHKSKEHKIAGAGHSSIAAGLDGIHCRDCHEGDLHKNPALNRHSKRVACETCHIPSFARQKPTKVWWDWSKAGEERAAAKDEYGMETYNKMKGEFQWAQKGVPEYAWFNGSASYYRFGQKIDANQPVLLNVLKGDRGDSTARIAPFKVMRGRQIYDAVNNYLIIPKLFGENGYWKAYDWNLASQLGMQEIHLDYSGQYGFVETAMYWPINHMVAPKESALKCGACHVKEGRMDWSSLGYTGDPMRMKKSVPSK